MTHLTNKNPFKNQGLAIFGASVASFGKRFGKKKANKISKMPRMTQIVGQNVMGRDFGKEGRKKEGERECKRNVNKPYRNVNQKVAKSARRQDA